ncbi:ECF transporter S component (folate family) [Sedimentibacter acidaminivorans]|uniref:ECF transporter S component (Folate family) n=1 Tax=Sedimentibacter acidaminivorans TaxID=913099 RepID=A0ABS4G9Y7_9FIRM|nr:folate family ECF transporter S component [Sedimentibacter acidaminivorans]MBP1924502.1 ECF transporter S component (folate family) [Sedimentibacter acidaminivorans]
MSSNTLGARKITALAVVRAGLFIAMSLVLKVVFEIYIPLGGIPALRINFAQIPIMLSGILLGPTIGFCSGAIADIINFMIKPGGPFFPGFTLVSALSGFIPGLIFKYIKKEHNFNLLNTFFISLLSVGFVLAFMIKGVMSFEQNMIIYDGKPLSFIYIIGFVILVAAYLYIPIKLTSFGNNNFKIDKVVFTVSITQLITSILLNTYFLSILYGKGFLMFLPARILTSFFMIPLYSILIAAILGALNKRLLNQ